MIIGICGRSCSGKTEVSKIVSETLRVEVIHLDSYYIKGSPNWEVPEAHNLELLREDLEYLKKEKETIVVEGFLLFVKSWIVQLINKKIYISISDNTLVTRRLTRTDIPSNINYILDRVLPWSKLFETAQQAQADLIVDGEQPIDKVVRDIMDYILEEEGEENEAKKS